MIKIVAFKERTWMPEITDFRQWDHLCRSYGAELQMVTDFHEIIIPNNHKIVILDEPSETNLEDFEHPEDVVYVFGRTGLNDLAEKFKSDYQVKINYEPNIPLFGIASGAIVLYDRYLKLNK